MITSFLELFETDVGSIDCDVPEIISLKDKTKVVIGRGSELFPVDVRLSARKHGKEIISRHHASIVANDDGSFTLNDIAALNGVFVNDIRIKSVVLRPDDIVQFGGLYNSEPGCMIEKSDISVKYQFKQFRSIGTKKRPRSPEDESNINPAAGAVVTTTAPTKKPPILIAPPKSALKSPKIKTPVPAVEKKISTDKREALNTVVATTKLNIASNIAKNGASKNDKKTKEDVIVRSHSAPPESAHTTTTTPNKNPTAVSTSQSPSSTSTASASSSYCNIDISSLKSNLKCILCNDILLDTAILKCSHAFCRSCLESHIRHFKSLCPICNSKPVRKLLPASCTTGYSYLYSKSDHLESLVWLLLEASPVDKEAYDVREKKAWASLLKLGINPDLPYADSNSTSCDGSGNDRNNTEDTDGEGEEEEEEGNRQKANRQVRSGVEGTVVHGQQGSAVKYAAEAATAAMRNGNGYSATVTGTGTPFRNPYTVNKSNGSVHGSGSKEGHFYTAVKAVKPVVEEIQCDYCGSAAHVTRKCPHKDSDSSDDENGFGGSDDDEDEDV